MAIKLTSRVKHNGVRYQAGDIIGDNDITEAQENQLIDAGAAVRGVRGAATKGGEKVEREEAGVKTRLGAKSKPKKTVSEKAQARNKAKSAKAVKGKKVPQAKPAEVDGKVPPKTEDLDGGEGGQDGKQGNDNGGVSFKLGDDEYTTLETANGQTQYRKNGGMISKVDFNEAAKEAGVEA